MYARTRAHTHYIYDGTKKVHKLYLGECACTLLITQILKFCQIWNHKTLLLTAKICKEVLIIKKLISRILEWQRNLFILTIIIPPLSSIAYIKLYTKLLPITMTYVISKYSVYNIKVFCLSRCSHFCISGLVTTPAFTLLCRVSSMKGGTHFYVLTLN
jgi:hypothetical protein